MLYRSFARNPSVTDRDPGGALFVPRWNQGAGRHDNPYEYGTLYASRTPESAVAEYLQYFRGQSVSDADLRFADGRALHLAAISDDEIPALPDLDDPQELVAQKLRPSTVATRDRAVTQAIALELFGSGAEGFSWWSTIEAAWINVTLFAERAIERLALAGEPEVLTIRHPAVVQAAGELGIPLSSGGRS